MVFGVLYGVVYAVAWVLGVPGDVGVFGGNLRGLFIASAENRIEGSFVKRNIKLFLRRNPGRYLVATQAPVSE